MDQDQMDSLEVFDPVHKCHYRVLVPHKVPKNNCNSDEEITIEEQPAQNITTWSQTETLALINIFSLHKHRFKDFKKRREQWNLVSKELSKIGIHKVPEKCEIKWKNLLRVYRQHKNGNKGRANLNFSTN
ncbi:hypothetical protein NQ314_012647 [Rhamnusium bicolor]|uniref:Myb-like domain-containing protein n=1 Tax=Rhamnusium bicolor TaxID=1586634 RepID=A0AAV8XB74_9CUCU|nr:hypothetical protein NQ314_012647 [Rhamnusium bicolor]